MTNRYYVSTKTVEITKNHDINIIKGKRNIGFNSEKNLISELTCGEQMLFLCIIFLNYKSKIWLIFRLSLLIMALIIRVLDSLFCNMD